MRICAVIKLYAKQGERLCDKKRNDSLNRMRCSMTSPLCLLGTVHQDRLGGDMSATSCLAQHFGSVS